MLIIRTHGGIGNQIFQIFYARLLAHQLDDPRILRTHDACYPHLFGPCKDFEIEIKDTGLPALISWLRLPKVAFRLGISTAEMIRFGQLWLLDGYFQDSKIYRVFSCETLLCEIERLRHELNIPPAFQSRIVHIRLGDFFIDEASALRHVEERFADIGDGGDLISNRDDVFAQPCHRKRLAERGIRYLQTENMSARKVLELLARYRRIESNNSTLAFWAAMLGGGQLYGHDANQRDLRTLLGCESHDGIASPFESVHG